MYSVDLDPVEFRTYRARSFGVGSCRVTVDLAVFLGPVELVPVELDPGELDPVELDHVEIDPVESDPVELGPVDLIPLELGHVDLDSPMEFDLWS
jgi:hypothetical protein